MKRAIDEIVDIHVKAEIDRLLMDINQKCGQIACLLGNSSPSDKLITWSKPTFYKRIDGWRTKIL